MSGSCSAESTLGFREIGSSESDLGFSSSAKAKPEFRSSAALYQGTA
jgi:hypothetical protein